MIGLETWWDQKWKNIYFWSARVTVANWYMTYIWPRLTPWGKGLDFRSRAPCITEASHHMCQIVKALAVINLLPSGTCVFLVVMFSWLGVIWVIWLWPMCLKLFQMSPEVYIYGSLGPQDSQLSLEGPWSDRPSAMGILHHQFYKHSLDQTNCFNHLKKTVVS